MSILETLYVVISILAALICAGIGILVFQKKQTGKFSPFSSMMLLITLWIAAQLLSMLLEDPDWIMFWTNLRFLPIALIPYTWLLFSLQFFLSSNRVSKKIILALAIVPFITQIMVWTNPLHHWFIVAYKTGNMGMFYTVTEWHWGPWFIVHAVYSYSLLLIGIILIIHAAVKVPWLYRGQAILIIISSIFPTLITLAQALEILPTSLDMSPIAFSLTGIILFINIVKYNFSSLIPIEKEKLIEFMRDGMIIINQQYEILDINPAALSYFKANLSAILGKKLVNAFPYLHEPDLEQREVYEVEPRIGKEIKHFEIITSPIQRENFIAGWFILIRDTTEHKLVELAYKEIERRLNKVILHSHDGIIITDTEGKIIVWNKAIQRLLNAKRADILGRYIWDIIPLFTEKDKTPSESFAEVEKELRQSLVTGKSSLFNTPIEIRLFANNQREYYAEVVMYSIKVGNGYYICFSEHNITDQIEARQALQKSYETLEQQVKERTADLENLMDTLEQRIQDRTKDLSILYQISATANQITNLEEMLQTCLELILNALEASSGTIHIYNPENQSLSLIAHANLNPDFLFSIQNIPAAGNIFGRVIVDSNTVTVLDLSYEDSRQFLFPKTLTGENFTYIGNLMKTKGKKIGVLSVFQPASMHFSIEQVALLTTISEQLGVVIENHKLQRNAETLAVLEERQRLARDLHDSVTQRLYSLMLYASAGIKANLNQNNAKVSGHLEQIDLNAQQALREMRLLINELRPDDLEKEGFIGAIQRRLNFVEKRAGIEYEFQMEGTLDLSHQEETELFNILTEALNNALKHANASKIRLSIFSQKGYFRMELWDNGTGFDIQLNSQPTGYGFISMRERADKIGGILTIRSTLNSHTCIMVELGTPPVPSITLTNKGKFHDTNLNC
jgi:PAS domain S-box-containing protein